MGRRLDVSSSEWQLERLDTKPPIQLEPNGRKKQHKEDFIWRACTPLDALVP
jgi:hypothetical protein